VLGRGRRCEPWHPIKSDNRLHPGIGLQVATKFAKLFSQGVTEAAAEKTARAAGSLAPHSPHLFQEKIYFEAEVFVFRGTPGPPYQQSYGGESKHECVGARPAPAGKPWQRHRERPRWPLACNGFFIRAQLFQQVGYLPVRYRGLRDLFHRTFLDGNAKKNSDRRRKGTVAALAQERITWR
jgi:hypothetical protein